MYLGQLSCNQATSLEWTREVNRESVIFDWGRRRSTGWLLFDQRRAYFPHTDTNDQKTNFCSSLYVCSQRLLDMHSDPYNIDSIFNYNVLIWIYNLKYVQLYSRNKNLIINIIFYNNIVPLNSKNFSTDK